MKRKRGNGNPQVQAGEDDFILWKGWFATQLITSTFPTNYLLTCPKMPSRGRGDFVPTPAFPAQADRLERPPGIINTLPSPTFGVVAKLFQNIRETKGSKSKVVESFIEVSIYDSG